MKSELGIGLHRDVPFQTYLDDPGERPSLSASMAGILLGQSPAHAYLAHPRLSRVSPDSDETVGETEEDDDRSGVKARGTLGHALVLGGGLDLEVVQKTDKKTGEVTEATDYRAESARAHRDAIIAAGRTPVIGSKLEKAKRWAEAVRDRIQVPALTEVTAIWESGGVLCRGRMDGLDNPQVWDLKTCVSAVRAATGNHALDFGLHIQEASYTDALETLFPELQGRVPPMQFCFVEIGAPFEFKLCALDAELREYGQRQWARAKSLWQACLTSGVWPGYSRDVTTIAAPPKLAFMEQDQMLAAMPEGGSVGISF